jgi:hypothetical protein
MAQRRTRGERRCGEKGRLLSPGQTERYYKNVTGKIGAAALKWSLLCILQLNRAVKSEIIRLK